MGRSAELMDFERGQVIECHLCHTSVREISTLLNIPRSIVSDVIVKWKREGTRTAQNRTGRPCLLIDRDRQQLKRVVMCNRQTSIQTITQEFQTASGYTESTMRIRRYMRKLEFHDRVSAHKPHINYLVIKSCFDM